MRDFGEIILDGLVEKERIKLLKTKTNVIVQTFSNRFEKFYCPTCKDELLIKTPICKCGQNLEWNNKEPNY